MCDIDDPGRNVSAAVSSNASAALAHIQPSVSRLWVTPFAGPVLPDVKKIAAGSDGATSGSGHRAGLVATQLLERRTVTDATFERDDPVRQLGRERAGGEVVGRARRGPRAPPRR